MKFKCRYCGRKFRSKDKKTRHEQDCNTKQTSLDKLIQ